MYEESREFYATKEATVSALISLSTDKHGVALHRLVDQDGCFEISVRISNDDWSDDEFDLEDRLVFAYDEVRSGRVYTCGLGYCCVVVDDDIWQAPIVWAGPRATWDTETEGNLLSRFVAKLRSTLIESPSTPR